jgi:hypothetical protein
MSDPKNRYTPSNELTLSKTLTQAGMVSLWLFWTAILTTICRFYLLCLSKSCMQDSVMVASILDK